MKVFISADMEGIAGVVHHDQTKRNGQDYEQARKWMTNETNAAIKGAIKSGGKEIIVNDSHGAMRNLNIELLSHEATLISGAPKRLAMMEGISSDFDAAIFIGYHTRCGLQGILNHTYNGKVIDGIRVNGKEYGEFGLNALIAGEFGVPVVFVSGCDLLIQEAKALSKNIETAQVKRTVNQVTSENLHPEIACKLIEESVNKALKNYTMIKPLKLNTNKFRFDISFTKTLLADIANSLPMIHKTGDLSVCFTSDSFVDGFLITRALIMMTNNYAE